MREQPANPGETAALQSLLAENFMWCRPQGASLMAWVHAVLVEFAPAGKQARADAAEARVKPWLERMYRGDGVYQAIEALKAENAELRAELKRKYK